MAGFYYVDVEAARHVAEDAHHGKLGYTQCEGAQCKGYETFLHELLNTQ